jgi:hypothetical protein
MFSGPEEFVCYPFEFECHTCIMEANFQIGIRKPDSLHVRVSSVTYSKAFNSRPYFAPSLFVHTTTTKDLCRKVEVNGPFSQRRVSE